MKKGMHYISDEESRSLAATLVTDIKKNLLISVANQEMQLLTREERSVNRGGKNFKNSFQDNYSGTCVGSRCSYFSSNLMLSNNSNDTTTTEKRLLQEGGGRGNSEIPSPSMLTTDNNTDNPDTLQYTSIKYGKKCPKCFELNEKDANWCLECGKAIISVEVRRCDLMGVGKIQTHLDGSHSAPSHVYKNSISFEEDYLQFPFNDANIFFSLNQPNDSLSIPFDFQNPRLEEDFSYMENATVYPKNFLKKEDTLHRYAFDDLLYPNYAIQDPVHGFILPSSNIVSNGLYYQPQFIPEDEGHKGNEANSGRRNKRGKQRRYRNKAKKISSHSQFTIANPEIFLTPETCSKCTNVVASKELKITCLPEEVILYTFSMLRLNELATCARVCKMFNRIATDLSLWKDITIKKRRNLTDHVLEVIARKHPTQLTISQCNGKLLTENSLRHLFRSCADSLQVLDISACSGGVLIGETVLFHVSSRCHNIKKLDVSWTNVSNIDVQSISNALTSIIEISLNGCQGITDEAVISIAEKHAATLELLEVFGCFNVSLASINSLAKHCKILKKLNLGQCHKINGVALCTIAGSLHNLQTLDIRGCKQVRDGALKEIIMKCDRLTNLVVANCPMVTDHSLIAIGQYLPDIKCLDSCGCGKVSDRGVQALVRSCHQVESLDLSSTRVTGKSVSIIGHFCRNSLISLKLSFCHSITDQCLNDVVKKCQKLKIIHLYGCKPVRTLQKLMEMNPNLKIEKESLR